MHERSSIFWEFKSDWDRWVENKEQEALGLKVSAYEKGYISADLKA